MGLRIDGEGLGGMHRAMCDVAQWACMGRHGSETAGGGLCYGLSMWWLWLACTSALVGIDLERADIVDALEPDGWHVGGCAEVRSTGVHRTACTLRRSDAVAVVTLLSYDRSADAARAWSGADAVGWRAGRQVVQVDAFDEAGARAVLATLPPRGAPLPNYACEGRVCRGTDPSGRGSVVGPDPGGRPAPGYVVEAGWIVAVEDREVAAQVVRGLRQR